MSGTATTAAQTIPPLAALDSMGADEFADALGQLFERAPRFMRRLAVVRPFDSWDDLFDRAVEIALAMPEPEQVELLDGHPRLGADPAATRARSELSYREQGYDRPAATGSTESAERERIGAELARLNDAYETRFGFRYVVLVAGRSRSELLPGMSAALAADRSVELERGLRDVVTIARDRWTKLSPEAAKPAEPVP